MKFIHPKRTINRIRIKLRIRKRIKERNAAVTLVEMLHGGFWKLREKFVLKGEFEQLYWDYCEVHCSYIGKKAEFLGEPILPHGLCGIFISNSAKVGRNVTIFQHVTIGSNTLKDTSSPGAPQIGDHCVLGAGCIIIGGVKIGDNCRIGAGAVVWKDVPPNTTVVTQENRYIIHNEFRDNTFLPNF